MIRLIQPYGSSLKHTFLCFFVWHLKPNYDFSCIGCCRNLVTQIDCFCVWLAMQLVSDSDQYLLARSTWLQTIYVGLAQACPGNTSEYWRILTTFLYLQNMAAAGIYNEWGLGLCFPTGVLGRWLILAWCLQANRNWRLYNVRLSD